MLAEIITQNKGFKGFLFYLFMFLLLLIVIVIIGMTICPVPEIKKNKQLIDKLEETIDQ